MGNITINRFMIYGCLTVLFLLVHHVTSFEFSGYCSRMCMWGRGGNLCKCSAVHFAGKRTYSDSGPMGHEDSSQVKGVGEYRIRDLLQKYAARHGKMDDQRDAGTGNEEEKDLHTRFYPHPQR